MLISENVLGMMSNALADFVSTSSSFCFELSCVMAVVTAQVDVLLLPVAYSISCRHKK